MGLRPPEMQFDIFLDLFRRSLVQAGHHRFHSNSERRMSSKSITLFAAALVAGCASSAPPPVAPAPEAKNALANEKEVTIATTLQTKEVAVDVHDGPRNGGTWIGAAPISDFILRDQKETTLGVWVDVPRVARGRPVLIAHGEADSVLSYSVSCDQIAANVKRTGGQLTFRTFDGDHVMPTGVVGEFLYAAFGPANGGPARAIKRPRRDLG